MGGGVLNQDGGGDANSDTSARAGVGRPATRHAFARDGGLLSYGNDLRPLLERRLLCGLHSADAEQGDPPVQFPTKFEMVLNLKTAKAPGLAPVLRGAPARQRAPVDKEGA